jgi:RNA polymerase sigma-70 factor (ECF subfamily)
MERLIPVPDRGQDVARVYDDCHVDLFGYVASLIRDVDAAEDIVHEGFARLVQEGVSGRRVAEPRGWLYRVCTNLAFSRSRRRAVAERWNARFGRLASTETHEPAEAAVLRRERDTELHQALRTLPRDHQAALLLAAEGFNGREIAKILGRSEGATRNILWRSRLDLKDRLERDER